MKKLLILLIIIFSSSVLADENNIKCIFSFDQYSNVNGNLSSEVSPSLFGNIKFNVEFKTNSKLDWKISNISLSNNFKKILINSIEKERKIVEKILYEKKLNQDEKYMLSFIASYLDISVDEIYKEIRKLSNKEKKELINQYKKSIDEYMPMFDDFITNQHSYLNEIKNMLNSFNEISSEQNYIYITAVLDSGVMFKNTINYSKILNNNSSDAIKMQIVFVDGSSLKFGSKCSNNSNLFTDSSSNNDNNDIESKLKKLKSLFDQQLITQDEYDQKRKEILDAM